jgi:hypothetical protein
MKKNNAIYWVLTGAISFFMFFSAWYTGTHAVEFKQFGFPDYFRIELTIGKTIGAIILLFPQTPIRIREWIYVAFSIVLLSAFIAKVSTGYAISGTIEPLFTFALMLASAFYLNKLSNTA